LRTVSFDWRPEEHAEVTALLIGEQSRSGVWRVLRWVLVGLLALALLVAGAAAVDGDWRSAVELGALWILVVALVSWFPTITGRLQAWRVKRSDPNVLDPIKHTIRDTGLHISMRTLDAELRWSGMQSVRETDSMFLFHYTKRFAYYLPKRALPDSEAVAQLSSWIQERLPAEVPFVDLRSGV
jgi:hypothetical protein